MTPPPCDAPAVEALASALAGAEDPVVVAAAGWAKLCPADAVLASQVAQVASSRRESWWLVELQTGVVDAYGWHAACSGGGLALSMATKLDPADRRPYLWKHCALEKLGAFSEAEWAAAPGLMVIPVLAARTLADGGIPAERARPIVRALAGL